MKNDYSNHVFGEGYKKQVRKTIGLYHQMLAIGVPQSPIVNFKYVELMEIFGIISPRKQRKAAITAGITDKVVQFIDIAAGLTEKTINDTADTVEEIAGTKEEQPHQAVNLI